jgi:hypothetical protein
MAVVLVFAFFDHDRRLILVFLGVFANNLPIDQDAGLYLAAALVPSAFRDLCVVRR